MIRQKMLNLFYESAYLANRVQYLVFAGLSLGVLGSVAILYLSDNLLFQRFLGRINPLLAFLGVIVLGFALLSQAGVAIGLALDSAERFSELGPEGEEMGLLILSVVTATTFVTQLVGPVMVKFAVTRAGEVGKALEGEDAWASEGAPEIRG